MEHAWRQVVKTLFLGPCFLRHEKRPGWERPLPIYLVWCGRHKILFEDYSHGHPGREYFNCPKCFEEWREKVNKIIAA